jgi:hypothetical protein
MFQPQETPYTLSFSSFNPGRTYSNVDLTSIARASANVYGGPTLFEDRTFPPSFGALDFIHQHQQTSRQQTNSTDPVGMSEHDLHAQQLAAQDYKPEEHLQVGARAEDIRVAMS